MHEPFIQQVDITFTLEGYQNSRNSLPYLSVLVLYDILNSLCKKSQKYQSTVLQVNVGLTLQVRHTTAMETGSAVRQSPLLERKNKMSVISRFFKPWTWNRNRKKPSEKIQNQAAST